ncbi:MAG: PepSY domain-containing protein [Cellvibrionaceae bacterium]|nr:PepSY domain-containing protein [Cellvibrionaceae bacterium]
MNKNTSALLYRTLWRWHFYAGIFCLPFIVTLAISGTIYLFKPQVDAWIDAPYRGIAESGQRRSANEQIAAALAAHPDSRFVNYRLPQSPQDAVIITLQHSGENHRIYVHPVTLEILRNVPANGELMQVVKRFHGELLAGDVGSILVELAGCWAIVLVITGLYLWWPRGARGAAGILYPRLRQGSRTFWRDLHAVTGFWVAGFTLFLLITGLPWALVWGGALKEVRQLGNHQPQHQHQDGHDHHSAAPADWSLRSSEPSNAVDAKTLQLPETLVQNALALNFAPPAELSPAADMPGAWSLKSQSQNRPLRADAWLDGKSGNVIRSKNFAEKSTLDRVIGIGIAAHEGQLFGWFNQLLGVFTTSGLTLMSISAFILWRRRKPQDALGAPPPIPDGHVGKVVSGVILALALLLPLLAASLVIILLLEWLVLKRIQRIRRWLGLSPG